MKIALIPGHTKTSSGAENYKDESEYPWAKRVLTKAQKYMPQIGCFLITRDDIGIEGAVKKAKELGCTATIELHFNWSPNDPEKDIEILADKRLPKSIKMAKFLAKKENELYTSFGLRRDEGCFATIPSDRGGNNVAQGVIRGLEYCILWEPQFGNLRNSDAIQLFDDEEKFAKLIGESLTEFFTAEGLLVDGPTTKPRIMWHPEERFFPKMDAIAKEWIEKKSVSAEKMDDFALVVLPSAKVKIMDLVKKAAIVRHS